jgi:hypothetical protein
MLLLFLVEQISSSTGSGNPFKPEGGLSKQYGVSLLSRIPTKTFTEMRFLPSPCPSVRPRVTTFSYWEALLAFVHRFQFLAQSGKNIGQFARRLTDVLRASRAELAKHLSEEQKRFKQALQATNKR